MYKASGRSTTPKNREGAVGDRAYEGGWVGASEQSIKTIAKRGQERRRVGGEVGYLEVLKDSEGIALSFTIA